MTKINVSIFCDEIKNEKLDNGMLGEPENWDYIGVCIVPTHNISSLANQFNNLRCGADKEYMKCRANCQYHSNNQRKIHYQEYDNTNCYNIANRWCDIILNNYSSSKFSMHILGINSNKLDKSCFKTNEKATNVDENIYNRFFRTAITFSLKKYFEKYEEIEIDNIYHDTGNMNYHKYFKYQPLKYIRFNEERIKCNCNEITFVGTTSINCLNEINTLLQVIDLFLGGVFNMLHSSSKQKHKVAIAEKLFPIIDRCINKPYNINSRYHNVYSISFFPKKKINSNASDFEKEIVKKDNFYTQRELRLQEKNQLSFF